MSNLDQVFAFHRNSYDPNHHRTGPPVHQPYLKPRQVRVAYNPSPVSNSIQRVRGIHPNLDTNQYIYYGSGHIHLTHYKETGITDLRTLPFIHHLPPFQVLLFPEHTLPKVLVWESDIRPENYLEKYRPRLDRYWSDFPENSITPGVIEPEILDPYDLNEYNTRLVFTTQYRLAIPFVVTIVFKDPYSCRDVSFRLFETSPYFCTDVSFLLDSTDPFYNNSLIRAYLIGFPGFVHA